MGLVSNVRNQDCNPLITYLLKKGSMSFDLVDTHTFGGPSKEPSEEKQVLHTARGQSAEPQTQVCHIQRGSTHVHGQVSAVPSCVSPPHLLQLPSQNPPASLRVARS